MKPVKNCAFAKEFENEIKKLNATMTIAIYSLSVVLLKVLYDSLIQLSSFSMATIITLVVLLLAACTVMFKKFSEKSVKKISGLAAKLDSLLTLTRNIRTEMHSDVLLEKTLYSAVEMASADGGAICTIEGDRLVCKIAQGDGLEKLKGSSLPLREGVTGWVVESAQIVRMDSREATFAGHSAITGLEDFQFHSFLFAPMAIHSRVIGVIGIFKDKEKGFGREDEAFISYFADHAAISLEQARHHEDQLNFETHISEILLQSMDNHIPIKRQHSENVARYSHLIGKAIQLPFEREKQLHTASMLHDIGFIKYRADMELNPKIIKQHCVTGYNMLRSISCYQDVAPIILHHHERFDGNGYPAKLKGEEIPLESRIITIAEAFDAMTSASSYKKTLTMVEALQELMQNAGTQFDPQLVKTFVKLVYREKLLPISADCTIESDIDQIVYPEDGGSLIPVRFEAESITG